MQHKIKFLFISFLILFTSVNLFSQENKKPTRLLVLQDVVFPYKVMEYENAQKGINEFFKKNNMGISWDALQTDEFTYMYLIPFSGLGEVDELFKMWNNKIKASDQKEFGKLYSAFAGTIDRNNTLIVELKESYTPKNPYLKPEDAGFIHWDFFELLPGKETEANALLVDYKKMNEKLNIPVAYNQWSVVFGDNSTTIVFTTRAKDDVDFYTHNKETDNKMNKEPGGTEMYMKFLSSVRSFHHINGKPRPDLSIPASK